MTQKLTTEEFIRKAIDIHGSKYDYSKSVYVNYGSKIEIKCNTCGHVFNQVVNRHLDGIGCKPCSTKRMAINKRLSQNEFIERLKIIHGQSLIYTHISFCDTKTKVVIECPDHGKFNIEPSVLLKGSGCILCGRLRQKQKKSSNTQEFSDRAFKIHNGKFTYSNVNYKNCETKVSITCSIHGDFLMQPQAHLNGQGCPKCMKCGFNQSKSGTLYILVDNNILKVGITNRGIETRLKEINKSGLKNFKCIVSLTFENGEIPYKIERQVLKWLSANYQPVQEVFDGSTECFLNVDLPTLISFITPLTNEQTSELQSSL